MSVPTEMIGRQMRWEVEGQVRAEGEVIGFRPVSMMNRRTGEEYVGWRFKLKCDDGRKVWTCGFPPRKGGDNG